MCTITTRRRSAPLGTVWENVELERLLEDVFVVAVPTNEAAAKTGNGDPKSISAAVRRAIHVPKRTCIAGVAGIFTVAVSLGP
jgi:hypothetical protein